MSLEFIAEVGINHNGSLEKALLYCNKAKECGANYVKFQTFKVGNILQEDTNLATYQKINTDFKSQNEMLKTSEISYKDFKIIKKYCKDINIEFLTTGYDFEDIDFISKELKCKKIKLASISIVESSLLNMALERFEKVIISTGFTNQSELENISNQTKEFHHKINIMHCTSSYPCQIGDANINSIKNLSLLFPESKLGFSDHTLGSIAASTAVSLGAQIFEKHITLNKNEQGPDHIMSMEPDEYHEYINTIKIAHKSLGGIDRIRTDSENKNIKNMRRTLYSRKDIKKGERIDFADLVLRRPNNIENQFLNPIGKKATQDIKCGEIIYKELYE